MNNIYVDVSVLQTVPSSCVNRDDTGSPKTCIYGGVNRSRVSSQAWKRASRLIFKDLLPSEDLGVRTKKIVDVVKFKILEANPDMDEAKAEKEAVAALTSAGLKIKNPKDGTDALLLMSNRQAEELARLQIKGEKDKKLFKKALKEHPSKDMALFGRMVAADPSLNYDACCQVAHAVSTHEVETEFDYFTAVDDLSDEDNAGAAHIGVTEFNSSTMYRYATVNVKELFKTLGDEAAQAVCAFLEAFITSMPTGKQNSFANRTVPYAVYIAIREDQPVSLVPAFEKAVQPSEQGFEKASAKALVEYEKKTRDFVKEPLKAYVVGQGLEELGEKQSLRPALEAVEQELNNLLAEGKN